MFYKTVAALAFLATIFTAPVEASEGRLLGSKCKAGYAKGPTDTSCTKCAAGTYANDERTACVKCPLNTYNPDAGADDLANCLPCFNGGTTAATGAVACDCTATTTTGTGVNCGAACKINNAKSTATWVNPASSSSSDDITYTKCTPCPLTSLSNGNTATCSACPGNQARTSATDTNCDAGCAAGWGTCSGDVGKCTTATTTKDKCGATCANCLDAALTQFGVNAARFCKAGTCVAGQCGAAFLDCALDGLCATPLATGCSP